MSNLQGLSLSPNAIVDILPMDTANDPTSEPGSGSPLESAASSLRAAALLTLKSKRRKPVTDRPMSPSHRSIPTGTVLNYGEEDSTLVITASSSTIGKTNTSVAKTTTSEADDNREEGEISDTENTPTVPKPKKASKPKIIPTDNKSTSKPSPTSAHLPAGAKPSAVPENKMESTPASPVAGLSVMPAHQTPSYVVDADHVRPGLESSWLIFDLRRSLTGFSPVNEKQYEEVKDIILDLLGWGVDPDYILDTGVSKEIIYYVFTELRLRLPGKLDVSGLVPYQPPAPQVIPNVAPPPRQRSMSSAAAMPPPSIPPRPDAPIFTPGRVTHPSLPQKPPAPQGNSPVSPVARTNLGLPTQLTVLTSVRDIEQQRKQSGGETDLHQIEQLRKQELKARKAVQASRKNKAPANAAAPSPLIVSPPLTLSDSKDKDVDMAVAVPPESVEDFLLKSIGPVTDAGNGQVTADSVSSPGPAQFRRHPSPAPMDVDEIPGFFASENADTSLSRPLSAQSKGDAATKRRGGPPTEPPLSADTNSGFPEVRSRETGASHDLKEDIPPGEQDLQQLDPGRRGIKRPVASDFVDFELVSSRPSSGYSNGGASQPPSMRRKTTGSFASVSGMRRCVIDLSDSEDDGEGEVQCVESERGQRIFSPLPTRVNSTSSSIPHIVNGGDWAPPQHYASNGKSGTQSPAALLAKEEEIKKMREMIAMREQSRLKKLAVVCLKQLSNS